MKEYKLLGILEYKIYILKKELISQTNNIHVSMEYRKEACDEAVNYADRYNDIRHQLSLLESDKSKILQTMYKKETTIIKNKIKRMIRKRIRNKKTRKKK